VAPVPDEHTRRLHVESFKDASERPVRGGLGPDGGKGNKAGDAVGLHVAADHVNWFDAASGVRV